MLATAGVVLAFRVKYAVLTLDGIAILDGIAMPDGIALLAGISLSKIGSNSTFLPGSR
jgi:hypothetical protein